MTTSLFDIEQKIHLIDKKSKTDNIHINGILFTQGIEEIHTYGFNVDCHGKKRRYLIELHKSSSFAMIKFYPKKHRNSPRKYELRGPKEIGFSLSKRNVFEVLFACAILMRNYLDQNPDCFIGYVGQTDEKDNVANRRRRISQRASIYNLLMNSIFQSPKYKLSSRAIFEEVNLRLVRKVVSKQEKKITKIQMKNYQSFLQFFENHKEHHLNMMTQETRKKYTSQ